MDATSSREIADVRDMQHGAHDGEQRAAEMQAPTGPPPDYQASIASSHSPLEMRADVFTPAMSDDNEVYFRRDQAADQDATLRKEIYQQGGHHSERHDTPEVAGPSIRMAGNSVPGNLHQNALNSVHGDSPHQRSPRVDLRYTRREDNHGHLPRRAASAPPNEMYGFRPHEPSRSTPMRYTPQRSSSNSRRSDIHENIPQIGQPRPVHYGDGVQSGHQTTQPRPVQYGNGAPSHQIGQPRPVQYGNRATSHHQEVFQERQRQREASTGVRDAERYYGPAMVGAHQRGSDILRSCPPRSWSYPDEQRRYEAYPGEPSQSGFQPAYHPNSTGSFPRRQPSYPTYEPQGSSRMQTVNKVKRPAPFDGKSSWEDYLVQFEMIAEINNWDNRTKALELATSLRAQAMGVLTDLEPVQRENYDSLVAALASRFEPSNTAEIFRAKLKGKVRGKLEPLTELAHNIRHLTRKAYPSVGVHVREHLALESFIEALNDGELEWFVFQSKPKTIDQAVETALEFEAFKQGRRRRVGERHHLRIQHDVQPCPQAMTSHYVSCHGPASQEKSGSSAGRLLHVRDMDGVERCEHQVDESPSCMVDCSYDGTAEQNYTTETEDEYLCSSCDAGRIARMSNGNQNFNGANGQQKWTPGCYNCGDKGHFKRECPNDIICNRCGQPGHMRRDCNGSSQQTSGSQNQNQTQGNGNQLGPRAMSQQ